MFKRGIISYKISKMREYNEENQFSYLERSLHIITHCWVVWLDTIDLLNTLTYSLQNSFIFTCLHSPLFNSSSMGLSLHHNPPLPLFIPPPLPLHSLHPLLLSPLLLLRSPALWFLMLSFIFQFLSSLFIPSLFSSNSLCGSLTISLESLTQTHKKGDMYKWSHLWILSNKRCNIHLM